MCSVKTMNASTAKPVRTPITKVGKRTSWSSRFRIRGNQSLNGLSHHCDLALSAFTTSPLNQSKILIRCRFPDRKKSTALEYIRGTQFLQRRHPHKQISRSCDSWRLSSSLLVRNGVQDSVQSESKMFRRNLIAALVWPVMGVLVHDVYNSTKPERLFLEHSNRIVLRYTAKKCL